MKVFVMIPEGDLDKKDFFIVGKESDAKKLVECGMFYTYEVEEVLDSTEVNIYYSHHMMGRA